MLWRDYFLERASRLLQWRFEISPQPQVETTMARLRSWNQFRSDVRSTCVSGRVSHCTEAVVQSEWLVPLAVSAYRSGSSHNCDDSQFYRVRGCDPHQSALSGFDRVSGTMSCRPIAWVMPEVRPEAVTLTSGRAVNCACPDTMSGQRAQPGVVAGVTIAGSNRSLP